MKNGNDITLEDLEYGKYDFYEYGNIIKWGNEEYVVVQETLMDGLFKEYMEEYIDECVIGDIPESLRGYFDYEAYIDDWENDDGYSVMASYDGYIDDIDILGDQYYVFRIN
jgi:antirestriction protein